MDGRALPDLMLSLRCGAERRAIPSCPEPTEVRYGSVADVTAPNRIGQLRAMCGRLPIGKGFSEVMHGWSVLPCVRPVDAALSHGRWP